MKKANGVLNNDVEQDYTGVMQMDHLIGTYCMVYANDLEEHICIKRYKLPATLGVATLLNSIFGLKPKVVGSGLITEAQYDRARSDLLYQMQGILDEKSPPVDSSQCEGEVLPAHQNINYNKAEAELLLFENFKEKKFHPTFQKAKSKVLRGEEK